MAEWQTEQERKGAPQRTPSDSIRASPRVVRASGTAGDGSMGAHTAWLLSSRLLRPQRQALVARLGRLQGNRHVQRVVAALSGGLQAAVVQRDLEREPPSDPEQLITLLGMEGGEGSFVGWFAGHWRQLLGLNPQRSYVGGMGAWTQGAGGTTEYTFRPNQRQQRIPREWYEEMRRLYRTGARITTSQAAIFWWNRDSLQETVNYWAPLFDPRIRSAAGEFASTFMRNEEYQRFLSVMRLRPPEITVPEHMRRSPHYSPR